ncbi:class I tRNA ligase family protein [Patescibacteria group bacterium]|nr:class I tRNA ligase family protein [Patescibacteria group bacterium]
MSEENKEQVNKSEVSLQEEKILEFWKENDIFDRSQKKESSEGEFVFYDGPPFATGLPHYGHILAGTIKDVLPRYQTMLGKKVSRRWGWDCHGLPVENLIEGELGLKTKQDIHDLGIEKFNQAAKESVLRYDVDWKEIIPRTGRWVDMDFSYKTMDTSYSESIWWIFKNIYDKGLIYEGHKAMHLCPRCETTLSNFEVNQGYKDIKDLSVTAEFALGDEPGTFVLAWTTTPWTLPGNVALAVGKDIDYVKIEKQDEGCEGVVKFILAKEKLEKVFKDSEYKIIEEFKGSELIGKSYNPIFDYYSKDEGLDNKKNGWKIYGADFVTTEDGTGIVHIAPAFGSDDMELGQKENLPFIQHVSMDGKFKAEVGDGLAGLYVKPKDDHMATDIEIIKLLAKKEVLFSKEKIEHSYPHCWRCKTPLLNYSTSSWFLKVTGIKDRLVEVNKGIKWVPENIKEGRFGKWLEGSRDWAISRSRFWGAPLPVWKCNECENVEVLGSIEDLQKKTRSTNNIFVMRHGEADNNILNVVSSKSENPHHLTEKGKGQVEGAISGLKEKKIDLIISSPFVRTKETAELVAGGLGIDKSEIIFEERIEEVRLGDFEGRKNEEYSDYFTDQEEKFFKNPINGENLTELKNRVGEFLYEIDKKYSDKNILIVTHEYPAWLLLSVAKGLDARGSDELRKEENLFDNADVKNLNFAPISHNANYESDVHMPYIDEIKFACGNCNGEMKRIEEVFDCWFESGSMPYASNHYPFNNLDKFNPEKGIGFPADLIAEGVDQTRGWFYTSLVLSTALFDQTAFKNVVVNGTILAEDGQKMSKSLKNYPDVNHVLNKYGADAMRYYLMSSPSVKAEDFSFSEKGVDEVLKKIILKTNNIYSFYELYKDNVKEKVNPQDSENVLDKWILARLNQLVSEATKGLNNYELDRASRPIMEFVDDLSTWYVRRSRDRFKGDDQRDKDFALETTGFVLEELSKVMAPFMPFLAEQVWQKVQVDTTPNEEFENDSVHLQKWPEVKEVDEEILVQMQKVRNIVSLALEARAKEGIKVRQPLNKFTFYNSQSTEMKVQLIDIIKDEVNVKDVVFEKGDEEKVELDIELTSELKAEGNYRELLRNVQKLRKEKQLTPSNIVDLIIETDKEGKELIEKFSDDLKKTAGIKEIRFEEAPTVEEIKIDDLEFKLLILR